MDPSVGLRFPCDARDMLLLLACAGTPCPDITDTTDYSREDSWICLPGREDLCSEELEVEEVLADGSLQPVQVSLAEEPLFDCFYVYPTMDLRGSARVHEDLSELEDERKAVQTQAAWLGQSCRVVAPAYRQATLGNYWKSADKREPCFEVAYRDAEAALDHYLAEVNEGRPYVLVGHSQGGQVITRLVREHAGIDERLFASYPIGWASDAALQCEEATQTDCQVSYKSYLDSDDIPRSSSYAEGEEVACVNPASPDDAQSSEVSTASLFRADTLGVSGASADLVLYRRAVSLRCEGSGSKAGLEVSWTGEQRQPYTDDQASITGSNGAHILDVGWAIEDLRLDMERRYQAAYSSKE